LLFLSSEYAEKIRMTVPILLADDDEEFRRILRQILQIGSDFSVVGEAEDGEVAVELAQARQAAVVLMDLAMPQLDGFEATRRIKAIRPETKILVLTLHSEEAYRTRARESGADAFLQKQDVITRLIPTIRKVLGGAQDQRHV
jgi:DNA-binding NarL/FixJ family response regulator